MTYKKPLPEADQERVEIILVRLRLLSVKTKKLISALAICQSEQRLYGSSELSECILLTATNKDEEAKIKVVLTEMSDLSSEGSWHLADTLLESFKPHARASQFP